MSFSDFLTLFQLQGFYEQRPSDIFVLNRHDYLTGTPNSVSFIFENHLCQIVIETTEFGNPKGILDLNFDFSSGFVSLVQHKNIQNDILPFLDFQRESENSLKFLSRFINEILVPKYQLGATTHNLA